MVNVGYRYKYTSPMDAMGITKPLRPGVPGGSLPAIRPGGTWAPPVATPPVATPPPVAGYAGQARFHAMTRDDRCFFVVGWSDEAIFC